MAKSNTPPNGPSKTGNESGKGRGNNPPRATSSKTGTLVLKEKSNAKLMVAMTKILRPYCYYDRRRF